MQGALLGLLALLLGFAFSGAMGRFVERQDALAKEANAIENAYDRVAILSNAQAIRAQIREYAGLRLRLFEETADGPASEIEKALSARYDSAFGFTLEGVRQSPQFANLAIPGVEEINDEFSRRTALSRRHLPSEFVVVMLICSCISLGAVGYGAGVARRRSMGSLLALAALTSTALFITFDFDAPRRGLIRLDGRPLEEMVARLGANGG